MRIHCGPAGRKKPKSNQCDTNKQHMKVHEKETTALSWQQWNIKNNSRNQYYSNIITMNYGVFMSCWSKSKFTNSVFFNTFIIIHYCSKYIFLNNTCIQQGQAKYLYFKCMLFLLSIQRILIFFFFTFQWNIYKHFKQHSCFQHW